MNLTRKITAAAGAAGLVAAALSVTLTAGPAQASSCGVWRWPVKTGSDATRSQVSRTVSFTTIGFLDGRIPPASFGSFAQGHRVKWPEFRTWELTRVDLVAVKLEDDGDIHMRLRSATGKLMIGEIPRPGCVSSASPWKSLITSARTAITSRYTVSLSQWHFVNRLINVRGLGFFDEEHGVTGAAPNDIELHPVTGVRFL
jgi:hypothetical protein